MNKLEIKNLTKIYGKKRANDGITVTLENGVYGLLGPNGVGKTTLMKQITTLIKPDKGEILYNGKDIFNMDDKYRNIIGYLPQEFGVYKNFTAKQFLQYVGALKGMSGKNLNSKVNELLELVGLYDVRNKSIGKFSGGMKRRVGIAQVLLNDPKIIVLDEPTAGLDPQERNRFRNLIAKISRDKIIILSTHIISDIESVAKETIMVKEGKLLMKGTHREILSDMGMELEWAEDGEICLQKFQESPEGYYDAILMDIRMPRMTGYDATKAIRSLERSDASVIPIIAMTADAFSEDIEKCLECQMNAHIAKPIDIKELTRLLKKYLI